MLNRSLNFDVEGLQCSLTPLRTQCILLFLVLSLACVEATINGRAEAQARQPGSGARIVDACSFITKWRPARLGC